MALALWFSRVMGAARAQEFDALKEAGHHAPEAHMLKNYRKCGQYQGCFCKWQPRREKQKWDLLVEIAPNLSKKICEVPNHVRDVLGIEVSRRLKSSI